MHPVKRLEIIATSSELSKLLEGLDRGGVPGYTFIRNVAGKGPSGNVTGDMAVSSLDNVYILAFCTAEQAKQAVELIKPLLNKFGGSCFVSDAMEVRSVRCIASM